MNFNALVSSRYQVSLYRVPVQIAITETPNLVASKKSNVLFGHTCEIFQRTQFVERAVCSVISQILSGKKLPE